MCCEMVIEREGILPAEAGQGCRHLDLPPEPQVSRLARRFVLEGTGATGEVADTVGLLTAELVANAVVHARTTIRVSAVVHEDHALVAVTDGVERLPIRRAAGDEATDGRGLNLLDALAERWGATLHDGGKSVWFTLLLDGGPI